MGKKKPARKTKAKKRTVAKKNRVVIKRNEGLKVEFCKRCRSILIPLKKGSSSIFKCRSCSYQTKKNVRSIKINSEEPSRKKEVIILEKDSTMLPITEQVCPVCENKKAYWWMQQTRANDEPPTQFFRCVKCRHVWREYK